MITTTERTAAVLRFVRAGARAAAMGVALTTAGAVVVGAAATAQDAGLGTWEDRAMIENTLQRYARGFDAGDPALFASAFAEDGVFEFNEDVFTGRSEIADYLERRNGGRAPGINRESRLYHVMTNSVITFSDAEHAHHSAYAMTIGRTVGETHISSSGSYEDDLVKVGGEWLIRHRVLDQLPVYNPAADPAPAEED